MNIVSRQTAHSTPAPGSEPAAVESEVRRCHLEARQSQQDWSAVDWRERLKRIGRIASCIAEHSQQLADSVYRPAAIAGEILSGEVAPLADACRYAARRGGDILRERKLPARDRAWWMGRIDVIERPEPWGLVLIIGPSNYPLLLPGVQAVQALAAGNSVLVKPAPQTQAAMIELKRLCVAAGVPEKCFQILPTDPIAARTAMDLGVDKIVFTGSARIGAVIAEHAAKSFTPAVLELSGCDAVVIMPDADLDRAAQTIAVALQMNGGETCIGPRRVFASSAQRELLTTKLKSLLSNAPAKCIHRAGVETAQRCVEQAIAAGATWVVGNRTHLQTHEACRPIVLGNVTESMEIARTDMFAPVLSIMAVDDMDEALSNSSLCRYALGASVFASPHQAMQIARTIDACCVTIDDIVVPTADPRASFGGRRDSGYGMTRGLEGLREMTRLKVICVRRGKWLPHLTTPPEQLAPLMNGLIRIRHGRGWKQKLQGLRQLWTAVRTKKT